MKCLECGVELLEEKTRRRTKYCSPECARLRKNREYRALNPNAGKFSPSVIGSINELRVVVDLLMRGFHVFRNVCPGAPCDLALLIDSRLIRVEVTTGSYTPRGSLSYPPHNAENRDLLAVVAPDKIIYMPELESLS